MTALTLGGYLRQVQSLVHDSTESAWTRREMFERINDARKDVSLDMQVVRKLVTGVQLMPGVEIYNFDGAVCGATVTYGGANYGAGTAAVAFSPPAAGGVQAEGYALVSNGVVTQIVMTQWGQWYSQVPTLQITDPFGTGEGATAVPVTMLNAINVLSISNLWNTMRYSLSYRSF